MKRPRPDSLKEVTARFVKAMNSIIGEKIASGEKYSMYDFADSIGYTRSNISKIVNKERGVNLNLVIEICRVHKVNPTWLITGKEEMKFGNNNLESRVKNLELLIKKKAAR